MEKLKLQPSGNQSKRNFRPSSFKAETVAKFLKQADDLRKKNQLVDALKLLDQCTVLCPEFDQVYLARAEIYRQIGQLESALNDLTTVIDIDPNNSHFYVQRGEVYRLLKQPHEALNDLNQAIKLDPDNPLALGRRGAFYRNIKKFVKSLADFNQALKLDPSNSWLYGNRAEVYRALKEYRKAIYDYTQVLILNPQANWVYERRSYTYLSINNLTAAQTDFERSWEANKDNLINGWMAEWTRMCSRSFTFSPEVEQRLQTLSEHAPKHYAAYLCRASLYWFKGLFSESYKQLETAAELMPDEPGACFWKGMTQAGLNKNEEALGLMQTALDLKLPPVLLSPAQWFKQINPLFYTEFEHNILKKKHAPETIETLNELTAPDLKNNQIINLNPEPSIQPIFLHQTGQTLRPIQPLPEKTLMLVQQVENSVQTQQVESLEDSTTKKPFVYEDTPTEIGMAEQLGESPDDETKATGKDVITSEKKYDQLRSNLNTINSSTKETTIYSPELAKSAIVDKTLTLATASEVQSRLFVSNNRQTELKSASLTITNGPVLSVKRRFMSGMVLLGLGVLAVGLLTFIIVPSLITNLSEDRPINSSIISQPASRPISIVVTISSTAGVQSSPVSTNNPTNSNPTNPVTAGPMTTGTTSSVTISPVTTSPSSPTERPTAVLAINVSPDPAITRLVADLKNFSNSILTGHTSFVYSVAFAPDGKLLASGSNDSTIRFWNVTKAGSNLMLGSLTGHQAPVYSVAFAPDGKLLASGSADSTIKLWQISITSTGTIQGKEITTLKGHTGGVNLVSFSPDGKLLASASDDKTIKLWDVASGKLVRTLEGHTFLVNSVTFNPDGKTLASASNDRTVKLWDVASGMILATLTGHTNFVNSVAFSPNGRFLASASSDKTVKLWNVSTTQEIATLTGHLTGASFVAFSPDGKILASGGTDSNIKLWDVKQIDNGVTELASLQSGSVGIFSLAFGSDGKTLADATRSQVIKLWEFNTNVFNQHE